MILVLAGTYQEFVQWLRENRMVENHDARFCHTRWSVAGVLFEEYTKTGTWWTATQEAKEAFTYSYLTHRIRDGVRV